MDARARINELATANLQLQTLQERELTQLLSLITTPDPFATRDVVLETVPALVAKYGDLSASIAADWYEQYRTETTGGTYTASLVEQLDVAEVEKSLRWALTPLWSEDPTAADPLLAAVVDRFTRYQGRDTIARNVRLDPAKPRWARVPTSVRPCAFCAMMASRGWVYKSAAAAGKHTGFHRNCSCVIVPSWDSATSIIDGYDPDKWYAIYQQAKAQVGNDEKLILARMRQNAPDEFSDGAGVVRAGKKPAPKAPVTQTGGGQPPKKPPVTPISSPDDYDPRKVVLDGKPEGNWVSRKRIVKDFGGTTDLPGKFTNPDNASLEAHEFRFVRRLLAQGKDLRWLLESKVKGDSTPDFVMDGIEWELKNISGSGNSTVWNAVKDAMKKTTTTGQPVRNAVIDITESPLTIEAAIKQIVEKKRTTDKYTNILVDGNRFITSIF